MRFSIGLFLAGRLLSQAPQPSAPPAPTFANTVRPFLEKHCQSCHNGKNRSGEINFEVLKYSTSVASQTGAWEKVALTMKAGRMPPEGPPRPPVEEAAAVREMIETGLARVAERKSPSAPPTREWLTWQADPERTGWARGETTLGKANASGIALLWKAQLDAIPTRVNGYSTLTDPLVAEGVRTAQGVKTVLFTASGENNVYALDAGDGSDMAAPFPEHIQRPGAFQQLPEQSQRYPGH